MGRTFTVVDMDGYSISQVAERTGFAPTTLRFYEQSGLVQPARTAAGYRCYDDSHIELLSFVGRAKRFGLSLDEISELLELLADGECAPVQGRLRHLVDAKIVDARAKIAELEGFTAELRRVADNLGSHTPAGPCDDVCGCTTDGPSRTHSAILLDVSRDGGSPDIACTLSAHELSGRLDQWEAVLADAVGREPIEGGSRLRFQRDVDIPALATLAAAEQGCCRFLTFTLTVEVHSVSLSVTGPADAQTVIAALGGAAS